VCKLYQTFETTGHFTLTKLALSAFCLVLFNLWAAGFAGAEILSQPVTVSMADAAAAGDVNSVRLALDRGTDVNAGFTDLAFTALHNASAEGHIDIVRLLLSQKAQVDKPDDNGATALIYAAYTGRTEIILLLLKAGADSNWAPKNGPTALAAAVVSGNLSSVAALIEHGAVVGSEAPAVRGTLDAHQSTDSLDPIALATLKHRDDMLALLKSSKDTP
jgi:ankyrin repeat protein